MSRELLSDVFSSLGAFLLERTEEGEFRCLGPVPTWAAHWMELVPGVLRPGDAVDVAQLSPFLENFLYDADAFWATGEPGRVRSGIWSEDTPDRGSANFDAIALRLDDGRAALLIQELDNSFEELFRLLQQARSANLDHNRLRREVDRKEVLLHCIVHDLKGPLSGMMGGYSLLGSRKMSAARQDELVALGLRHARKQNAMIDRVLGIFSAELDALEEFDSDPSRAPAVLELTNELLQAQEPSFRDAGVGVVLRAEGWEPDTRVVGHRERLERVILNLLENAIRHSPPRGVVEVVLEREGERAFLRVLDRGPGVPDAEVEDLFDRFRSGATPGSAGLGLYFCRLAVRPWGGHVSYAPRPGGGACFTVELVPARRE